MRKNCEGGKIFHKKSNSSSVDLVHPSFFFKRHPNKDFVCDLMVGIVSPTRRLRVGTNVG